MKKEIRHSLERRVHKKLFAIGQYLIERSKGLSHGSSIDNVREELKSWGVCIAKNCPLYGVDHGPEAL